MRHKIFTLFILACLLTTLKANTIYANESTREVISNNIIKDTYLKANTTYNLAGTIQIKRDATLFIPEGVKLIGGELLNYGKIKVYGNNNNKVWFENVTVRSEGNMGTDSYDINNLVVWKGDFLYRCSRFADIDIKNTEFYYTNGFECNYPTFNVDNCLFYNVYGIFLNTRYNTTIKNSTFYSDTQCTIKAGGDSSSNTTLIINNNNFLGKVYLSTRCSSNIDARNNYWDAVENIDEIAQFINDSNTDFSCENEISYLPITKNVITNNPQIHHIWGVEAYSIIKESTCITEGYKKPKCLLCNALNEEVTINIPIDPNKHSGELEIRNNKEATCTEDGYTGDSYCKDCGKRIHTGIKTEAIGHKWNDTVYSWSNDHKTCTAKRVCYTDCTHIESESVETVESISKIPNYYECGEKIYTAYFRNPLFSTIRIRETIDRSTCSHANTELRNNIDATCILGGFTGDIYCKDCGLKIANGEIIPNKNHEWSQWKVQQVASLSKIGIDSHTCKSCNQKEVRTFDKLNIPKKNQILTANSMKFKVISSSENNLQVSVIGTVNKNITKIVIPTTINIGNIKYKITSISANAFKNCKKLEDVSIGSNVTTINKNSFYNCTSLNKIIIPSKVIKIGKKAFYGNSKLKYIKISTKKLSEKGVGDKAFEKIYKKATVKIPRGKIKVYKNLLYKKGINKSTIIKE